MIAACGRHPQSPPRRHRTALISGGITVHADVRYVQLQVRLHRRRLLLHGTSDCGLRPIETLLVTRGELTAALLQGGVMGRVRAVACGPRQVGASDVSGRCDRQDDNQQVG